MERRRYTHRIIKRFMRKQDKYITRGVLIAGGLTVLLDYYSQKEKLKKQGLKLTWNNYNGFQTFKKATAFGIAGGIIGNEIYKFNFKEDCKKPFSSDIFLKNLLAKENINSDLNKLRELKEITCEVKTKLNHEFADILVKYPESVGSIPKKIAIAGTFDADIVLPVKKNNQFQNMADLSVQIHNKIVDLFQEKALVTKRSRATTLTFQRAERLHNVDIVYGKEIGNYDKDQNLNLYVRPSFFWQKGKTFKTNIDIQKNQLINKPNIREIIKILKTYRDRNNLDLNNIIIEQLSLEALSPHNFGKEFSTTKNLKQCMEYIAYKLNNNTILDYANSNHNLLNDINYSSKQYVLNFISNDLSKINSNPHYIKEIFNQ